MVEGAREEQYVGRERVPWSVEEDKKLFEYMERNGGDHQTRRIRWNDVSKGAGLMNRNGKACRLRWVNYLRPDIKTGPFTQDEVATIMELQKKHGNKWAMIAEQLPGRTEIGIKNFWNTRVMKKKKISKKETPGDRGSRGAGIVVTDASLHQHQLLGTIGKLQSDDAGFTPDHTPPTPPPQYGHASNKSSGSVPFVAPVLNSPEESEPSKAKANEAAWQSPSEMLLHAIANPNNNSIRSIAFEEWIDEIHEFMDILENDDLIMEWLPSPVSNSPEEPEPSKAKVNEAAGQSPSEMLLPTITNPNNNSIPSMAPEEWIDEICKHMEISENDNFIMELLASPLHHPQTPPCSFIGSGPVSTCVTVQEIDRAPVEIFDMINLPPEQEIANPNLPSEARVDEYLKDNEAFREDYYSLEEPLASIIPSPPPPHYPAVSTPCRQGMDMAMVDHHQARQIFPTNNRQPKLHSDVGGFTLNNTPPPKQLTSPSTSFNDAPAEELLMDNEVFRGENYSFEELLASIIRSPSQTPPPFN